MVAALVLPSSWPCLPSSPPALTVVTADLQADREPSSPSLSLSLVQILYPSCSLSIPQQRWRTSAKVVAGSAAWFGRGFSCVCAQRRESDDRPSFDLTPFQSSLEASSWKGRTLFP